MMLISFAWTTPALLAGAKTCTRRSWPAGYAEKFHAGQFVAAWDRLPRAGGKPVGTIRIERTPYLENVKDAPDTDFEAEGLAWMAANGLLIQGVTPAGFWADWKASEEEVYVVRFALVSTTPTRQLQLFDRKEVRP